MSNASRIKFHDIHVFLSSIFEQLKNYKLDSNRNDDVFNFLILKWPFNIQNA